MNNHSCLLYLLVQFGEYNHDGLWRNTEVFESYDSVYKRFTEVVGGMSEDPNLRGAAVIRTDDSQDFWYIEDSVGLDGLDLYKENGSFHIAKR